MRQFALFVSGAGLVLLLYVSSQYGQMYNAQRKLAVEWQEQNARPANIGDVEAHALVRLTIAKIKLNAVVVEGTSHRSLKLGPGTWRIRLFQNIGKLGDRRPPRYFLELWFLRLWLRS